MTEEDISQEFKLKWIKELNNYSVKEINPNELLSNKKKKVPYDYKLHWAHS